MIKLEFQNLSVGYGKKSSPILNSINSCFTGPGQYAIVGQNGEGKTTLLKTIASIIPPIKGEILFNEVPFSKIDLKERARIVASLLTETHFSGNLTVSEIVALGRVPYTGIFGTLSSSDKIAIESAIELCKLEALTTKQVSKLSDGQRQRVFLARAIAQETPILVLDEPAQYLDFKNQNLLNEIMLTLSHCKLILFSTHNIHQILGRNTGIFFVSKQNGVFLDPNLSQEQFLNNFY